MEYFSFAPPLHLPPTVDLFLLFKYCEGLGGGDVITSKKLWKQVNKAMGGSVAGSPTPSLSAGSAISATTPAAVKRYYEKQLLPYER